MILTHWLLQQQSTIFIQIFQIISFGQNFIVFFFFFFCMTTYVLFTLIRLSGAIFILSFLILFVFIFIFVSTYEQNTNKFYFLGNKQW